MKNVIQKQAGKLFLSILFICANAIAWAQDGSGAVSSSTTTSGGTGVQPWLYVVIGVLIFGVVAAILSRKKKALGPGTNTGAKERSPFLPKA